MPLTAYMSRYPSLSRSPNFADQVHPVASTPRSYASFRKRPSGPRTCNTFSMICGSLCGSAFLIKGTIIGIHSASVRRLRSYGFMSVAKSTRGALIVSAAPVEAHRALGGRGEGSHASPGVVGAGPRLVGHLK